MTTIIYNRENNTVYADRLVTGWHSMWEEKNKIIKIESETYWNTIIALTWHWIENSVIREVYDKWHQEKWILENNLQAKDFYIRLKEESWMKELDIQMMIVNEYIQVIVTNDWFIEEMENYWCTWSWYELANALMEYNSLFKLDIDKYMNDMYEVISRKDHRTGKEFNKETL